MDFSSYMEIEERLVFTIFIIFALSLFTYLYDQTRMTISISSAALWSYKKSTWKTESWTKKTEKNYEGTKNHETFLIEGQNIYRIDAHIWEECARK